MAAKGKTVAQLRQEAFVMLEIESADVNASPRIEHLFKGLGGKAAIWQYLEGSEEPEARTLLKLRRRLNQGQAAAAPFEAFCIAAKVPVKRMFGIISQEVMEQSAKATDLLFRATHPAVVQATIKRALGPLGTNDAKMLHQAAAFVPIPKTSTTIIHGNVDARQQTANVQILPPIEESAKRLSDRFLTMKPPDPPDAFVQAPEDDGDEDDSLD